ISKIYVPFLELQTVEPAHILSDLSNYRNAPLIHVNERVPVLASLDDYENEELEDDWEENVDTKFSYSQDEVVELSIIESSNEPSRVFHKILNSINTYLIRNKGAASDFNLVKDI